MLFRSLERQGAEVTVIRANVDSGLIGSVVSACEVEAMSAQQMYDEVESRVESNDIIIMAAAVADFTPETVADYKIKKDDSSDTISLTLKKTLDIAKMVGERKSSEQCFVGFALETNDEKHNAKLKLQKKNFDFIVLNSLRDKGAGFGTDTNKITIFSQNDDGVAYSLKSKMEVAKDIVEQVINYINR